MARRLLFAACALALAGPLELHAQTLDPVDVLLERLDAAMNARDRDGLTALFDLPEEDLERLADDLLIPGAVRSVVRERDRAPLEGVPEGDGFQLVVEIFVESAGRARIMTTGFAVRRPSGGHVDSWRVVAAEGVASVDGLYRLRLNTAEPLAAERLELASEDLVLSLVDGLVFRVESDDGVTGLVLIGRGEMRFSPAPPAEKGQLRLFSGSDTLVTPFETAYVRMSPSDYRRRIDPAALAPVIADRRAIRRAQDVFSRESPKSYNLDLRDLSRDAWHLLPPAGDFLAEINTRRHNTLTYLLSSAQAEDVSLFQRHANRTIALYASAAKIAARGRFYSDDLLREYDVLDYSIDAAVNPDRQYLEARARLTMRVRSRSVSTLTLRLAEPLVVTSVTSVEYGRLLFLRIRNQNTVLISLPRQMAQDADLTLVMTYAGRLPSQELDVDTVQVAAERQEAITEFGQRIEPSYVLSNRAAWYPQNPVADYATATMRITVPDGWGCVASGEPVAPDGLVSLRDLIARPQGRLFVFRSVQPLRYLAFIVSRFTRAASATLAVTEDPEGDTLALAVEANPRIVGRARQVGRSAEDILRFYTSLMHGAPFPSTTIALIESELPGGHAPGYFAILHEPLPNPNISWRNDPAAFEGFPDFFLAHELAHQWWGQAVGWKNYHEQWLSEGFAQYFAALYAREARGDRVFQNMLRQFRRWSLSQADQGPIYLGYRLGHIKADLRVYRALVYNKGAAVLHMLRLLLGDDAFFAGLRRFYEDRKYQKAGTDDAQRAFELESGRDLSRFFERWIYGAGYPRVRYGWRAEGQQISIRFVQTGDLVFDLPVTVTLTYTDGRSEDVVVALTEASAEFTIPARAPVRLLQVNQDSASIAEFERM